MKSERKTKKKLKFMNEFFSLQIQIEIFGNNPDQCQIMR